MKKHIPTAIHSTRLTTGLGARDRTWNCVRKFSFVLAFSVATCWGLGAHAAVQIPPPDAPQTPPTEQPPPATQEPATTPPATAQKPAIAGQAQPAGDQDEIPEPEDLILETMDKVKLKCTYYAPPKAASEREAGMQRPAASVAPLTGTPSPAPTDAPDGTAQVPAEPATQNSVIPFILLHQWGGSREQLSEFAKFLQSQGHAAIVPDLRGHGDSIHVVGSDVEISLDKFRSRDYATVQKDIEACKKYLVHRHNESIVNIDLLCIVAVGKTSVLAVQWVLNDWFEFPAHNAEGIKQGQDVKAVVLVAPEKKLANLSLTKNLKHPIFTGSAGPAIPMMIIWSESDEESVKDSVAIHASLERARPDVKKIVDPIERAKMTTLLGVPVTLGNHTGVQLLQTPVVDGLWPYVEEFIANQVAAKSDFFPWKSREKRPVVDGQ